MGTGLEIAIIGMSGRFPKANDVNSFWTNICNRIESITRFSEQQLADSGVSREEFENPCYVPAAGVIEHADYCDAPLFNLTPREACIMDPQHRVFLECAWVALEDSGYDPSRYTGAIGVYAGSSLNTYFWFNLLTNPEALALAGPLNVVIANDKDFLPAQVSYRLNLRGPSVAVQTGCSTSLVAIHTACQALIAGECDIALAGGVSLSLHRHGYVYQQGGILSPDGHCRPFDAKAQGTVPGSGSGIVVLKRLAEAVDDGDRILSVIKGSAVTNDGGGKASYAAPSVDGQARAIAAAHAVAGVTADSIGYVETHGTGTYLGDPIEAAALKQAFASTESALHFCAIGSVKGNIGHLDAAAGVAGLIKTVLALHYRQLPPSLHYVTPNPNIDFDHSPFYVNDRLQPWAQGPTPRRAGVSSFGIGGTNIHVVLEEAPEPAVSRRGRDVQLLTLSAHTLTALETLTSALAAHLRNQPELSFADVAYTLQVGRRSLQHRRTITATNREEAVGRLEKLRSTTNAPVRQRPEVAFVFPGQGSQFSGMGRELYKSEAVFRQAVDQCSETVAQYVEEDLRTYIVDDADCANADVALQETQRTQPALFTFEYALAQLWISWGVQPNALLGHSVGEYVAACVAGVMSPAVALELVTKRAQLMQALPPGSMLAVALSETNLRPMLNHTLAIAAVNGPRTCVVSGPSDAISAFDDLLRGRGVSSIGLRTSHAFHSAMMDPMLEDFGRLVRSVRLNAPQIAVLSNLSGSFAGTERITDPDYWVRQVRETVRFWDCVRLLCDKPNRILLEVGPGQGLSNTIRQSHRHQGDISSPITILGGVRNSNGATTGETEQVLRTLGGLWEHGVVVNWERLHSAQKRNRVQLPSYPFERKRYLLGASQPSIQRNDPADRASFPTPLMEASSDGSIHSSNSLAEQIARVWKDLLGVETVEFGDDFFELGGDSLLAIQVTSHMRQRLDRDISVETLFTHPTPAQLASKLTDEV